MTSTTHPFPADAAEKRLIALRFWLLGQNHHLALRGLDTNRRMFTGLRKDGITPEFDHHVCQAQYLRTLLPFLLFPQETIAGIFFHDTPEDRGFSYEEIRAVYSDHPEFGALVAGAVQRVTKKWRGQKLDEEVLFEEMSKCPMASIIKGCDRIHNLQSMVGVFSPEKMAKYLTETEERILPMLKDAERRFPEQEPAYKNIRTILKMQVALYRHMLAQTSPV